MQRESISVRRWLPGHEWEDRTYTRVHTATKTWIAVNARYLSAYAKGFRAEAEAWAKRTHVVCAYSQRNMRTAYFEGVKAAKAQYGEKLRTEAVDA